MNRILIITDEKKSSENQAFSISNELIKKNRSIKVIHKKIDKSFFHLLPNKFIYLYLICQNFFKKDEFLKNINLIISCGRIAAPHSLFFKKKLKCKNCHILNPYFAHKSFDKIIVPEHDINKFNSSDNLIVTKGTLVNLSKLKSKTDFNNSVENGLLGTIDGLTYAPDLEQGFFDPITDEATGTGGILYPQTIDL